MGEQDEREAQRQAVAKRSVSYHVPGMDALRVIRDVAYRATSGTELLLDVYLPAPSAQKPPVVLLAMGYPDPASRVRAFGPLTSWAQLLAASGVAAVVYGTEAPAEDVHAVLHHIRVDRDALGVDADRIGLVASSGNVPVGVSALMRDRRVTCAAFLYGYTMDLAGSAAIADASAAFGFVNACAERSPDDLPADVPMLFVRAGRETLSGLNPALDEVVRQAVARNLPVWFVNHATGAHGFDLDDSSRSSRGVIEHVLSFFRLHLLGRDIRL